jgi:hypothetical protein
LKKLINEEELLREFSETEPYSLEELIRRRKNYSTLDKMFSKLREEKNNKF